MGFAHPAHPDPPRVGGNQNAKTFKKKSDLDLDSNPEYRNSVIIIDELIELDDDYLKHFSLMKKNVKKLIVVTRDLQESSKSELLDHGVTLFNLNMSLRTTKTITEEMVKKGPN